MDIYDRISELLKVNKKSRKEMCDELNIPYSTINSLYQRRTERIKFDLVEKIAAFLGTTTDYLAFGKIDDNKSVENELNEVFSSLSNEDKNQLLDYAIFLKNKK